MYYKKYYIYLYNNLFINICIYYKALDISLKLPAGQRCTHRPHRWEEGGEGAGAGRSTMETSRVRFFCLGKRKEPQAPSNSEAQRSAPQSWLTLASGH